MWAVVGLLDATSSVTVVASSFEVFVMIYEIRLIPSIGTSTNPYELDIVEYPSSVGFGSYGAGYVCILLLVWFALVTSCCAKLGAREDLERKRLKAL